MNEEVYDSSLPIVSVIIATYNSSKTIKKTLDSIFLQDYPHDKLEVILVDGGSSDDTFQIAQDYDVVLLDNPKGDPGNAKMIGREFAHGSYILTLDHDEVLINHYSIRNKINAFLLYPDCKIALCTGYKRPKDYPGLNEYISEFGDPFSLFYYHSSYNHRYYIQFLKRKATSYSENEFCYVFDLREKYSELIMELGCGGLIFEKEFFSSTVNLVLRHEIYSYAFYDMMKAGNTCIIVLKDDPVEHYSVDSLKSYLPKLRWRIINNIHLAAGKEYGFEGRSVLNHGFQYKKYLFPLYTISIIIPLLESLYYSISRRNGAYLLHLPLCFFVTLNIIYQYVRKFLHLSPNQKAYDGSKQRQQRDM